MPTQNIAPAQPEGVQAFSFDGLARSLRAVVHHSSPIYVKRNIRDSTFIPHPLLPQQDFSRFALDYLVFGHAFPELRSNQLAGPR